MATLSSHDDSSNYQNNLRKVFEFRNPIRVHDYSPREQVIAVRNINITITWLTCLNKNLLKSIYNMLVTYFKTLGIVYHIKKHVAPQHHIFTRVQWINFKTVNLRAFVCWSHHKFCDKNKIKIYNGFWSYHFIDILTLS